MNETNRILIIDDDPTFRLSLADILQTKGYLTLNASTGKEALELVEGHAVAVALIDLKLEDMKGLDVLQEIQDRSPKTRCILLTGHASQEAAIQALNQGAYYFLQKPVDVDQLLLTIRNAARARTSEINLLRSEAQNRSIAEAIPDCILELNRQGGILHLLQPDDKPLFLPEVEAGCQLQQCIPGEAAGQMLDLITRTLAEDELQQEVFAIQKKEERRHFEIRMVPKGEDQVLTLVRDVTEQKEFQRQAERRRQYLESVLKAAPDAIITLDSSHRILEWSRGAERIFGYQKEEAKGRDLDELIVREGSGYAGQAQILTSHALNGHVVSPVETVRFRKDGSPVHVIVAGAPIFIDQELAGVVATYTDISDRVRAEKALEESEERYRAFMNNFEGIVYRSKMNFQFVFIHGAVKELTGYSEMDFLTGKVRWPEIIHPEDHEKLLSPEKILRPPERSLEREYRIEHRDGSFRWVSEVLQILREEEEEVYLQAMIRDISDQKELQTILDWQLRVNRDVAELSHIIIESAPIEEVSRLVMKKAKQLTGSTFAFVGYLNPGSGKLISLAMSDEIWEYYRENQREEIIRTYQGLWKRVLDTGEPEFWNEISPGEFPEEIFSGRLPLEKVLSCPVLLDGRGVGFLILVNPGEEYISRDLQVVMYLADIYALALGRKQTEQQLRYMATHDDLTDLPNRVYFKNTISQALTRVSGEDLHLAVMLLDLDKFKEVNDTYGHDVGDQVLQCAAERLRHSLRKSDTIARWGGDEFVIVVESDRGYSGPQVVVEKIIQAFSEKMIIEGEEIPLGVSVGVSLYPQDGRDEDQLIKNADAAMYQAKEQGLPYFFYHQLAQENGSDRVMEDREKV